MDIKFYCALFLGKLISALLTLIGKGATTAPGFYALKIDNNLVKKIIDKNRVKSIIITGTNGKTTTSRLTSHLLSAKFKAIHNRQGSNLLRGVASTLIKKASISANLEEKLAIWEIDEATLTKAVKNLAPQILVLLNLFRDQLDRYGEIDSIKEKWQKAISLLPKNATIIANCDDPSIASLLANLKQKVLFFGIADEKILLPVIDNVSDVKLCPVCLGRLSYKNILSSHLGQYFCSNCNFRRPNPSACAKNIEFSQDFTSAFVEKAKDQEIPVKLNLPGLFNIYNFLAASLAAKQLGISSNYIKESTLKFASAFGRFQKVQIGNKNVVIFLIKNPTGANEVIRTIASSKKINILAILNDKIADGRDVSWIWDTSWEALTKKTALVFTSGIRAWDLGLRFKYAGINLNKEYIHEDISYSITNSLNQMNNNSTLLILSTYTAMLETQKILSGMGAIAKWHKD